MPRCGSQLLAVAGCITVSMRFYDRIPVEALLRYNPAWATRMEGRLSPRLELSESMLDHGSVTPP